MSSAEEEPPLDFVHLPDDALTSILSACSAASLCRLACTSSTLSGATSANEPWHAVVWKELGIPSCALSTHHPRAIRRKFAATTCVDLGLIGCLTDGGVDGHDPSAPQPIGTADAGVVGESVRQFWVDGAFNALTPDDFKCYCSGIGHTGEAALNVTIAARVSSKGLDEEDARTREAARARRELLISCLSRVAQPLWGWHEQGFGGLRCAAIDQLEQAFLVAWTTPGGKQMMCTGLGADELRRLRHVLVSISSLQPEALPLASLTPGCLPAGRRLLVDLRAMVDAREWEFCQLVDRAKRLSGVLDFSVSAAAGPRGRADLLLVQVRELRQSCRKIGAVARAAQASLQLAIQCFQDSENDAAELTEANRHLDDALRTLLPSSIARASVPPTSGLLSGWSAATDVSDGDTIAGEAASGTRGARAGSAGNVAGSVARTDELASVVLVAPGALAVVAKLSVRRGVHCSCPVDCGFILGCRGPLTPAAMASTAMLALDDVLSIEQFPARDEVAHLDEGARRGTAGSRAPRLPSILHVHSLDEATVVELAQEDEDELGIFPIAWFRFDMTLDAARARTQRESGWHERGELVCTLVQPRSTRLLLAKLVSAENRMSAMDDDHAVTNIDVEHVGVKGWVVEELPSAEGNGTNSRWSID